MTLHVDTLTRPIRKFLPENFKLEKWDDLKSYFDELLHMEINSIEQLRQWFKNRSELEAVISEDFAWRYISMTRDTENKEYAESYRYFVEHIQPKISPVADKLNQKAAQSEYLSVLETETGYSILIRNLKKDIEIFREENIQLFTDISLEQQKYNQISGAMMVEHNGKEMTLQQASVLLMSTDRSLRQEIFQKITDRRLADKDPLDKLFSRLIGLRHQVALNAGFENFRDYMFKALGRFDYTAKDCFEFHDSIQSAVVPLQNQLMMERKNTLKLDSLKPWDKAVDPEGREALRAFADGEDLTHKGIQCFHKLDPFLGKCLTIMNNMEHLDLESRKGKAPGGYNYPLSEVGVPFIFMNATSTMRDMVTLMHEGGHAVHNFLTRELELTDFKSTPSEVAELASMTMELLSMDHWDIFFPDESDLIRAKREHLEDIIETLPWIATIDKFQHWIYEHPGHAEQERKSAWKLIYNQFADSITDWHGHEEALDYMWQKQLHLYEVPFYYIEYGMAQLGAIAIWKNYKENREKGLKGYMDALKLGYMKSIPEVYAAAGIQFDFSKKYIGELMDFVKSEVSLLK